MDQSAVPAPTLGLALAAGLFALLALAELALPFRRASQPKGRRWLTNLALFAIDTLAARLLLPLAMVGMAVLALERGWGLFNLVELPLWLAFGMSLLVLDLALYLQHWATHRVPLLWRLHRVHHTDRDFDVTTAARFHPGEIVLSLAYKMAVIAALGAPPMAVFLFETLFMLASLVVHANLALPSGIDRLVRLLLVTPDMHRVHHSTRACETDSNYGTVLSGWDRLFGTYCASAQEPLTIGLAEWQDERPARLGWSLLLPFRRS
ncbi:MAG: sterol desaturase family protein [Erythrobacter sp.]|nr:sterol desaturase family protein [Erythrobacter sp.]